MPLSLLTVASKVYGDKIGSHQDKHIKLFDLSSINRWGCRVGLGTEAMLLYLSKNGKNYQIIQNSLQCLFIQKGVQYDKL